MSRTIEDFFLNCLNRKTVRKLKSLFCSLLLIFCFTTKSDLYSQSNSADCQDEINISLGAECNSAIPWEGINSWKPSCMLIKDSNGNTVAAVSGNGSIIDTDEVECAIPIDSMWFDTLQRVKVRIHQIPGWTRNCDQLLNPDTVWIRESQMPGPLSESLIVLYTHP